jgi:hypothetical protein
MLFTAKELCGRKATYENGHFQDSSSTPKGGINDLGELELVKLYDHLALVAGYSDQMGRKRPNLWGMLILAAKRVIYLHPEGLTVAQVTWEIGSPVSTKNVGWALGKLVGSEDIRAVEHGDRNFRTYVPANQPVADQDQVPGRGRLLTTPRSVPTKKRPK